MKEIAIAVLMVTAPYAKAQPIDHTNYSNESLETLIERADKGQDSQAMIELGIRKATSTEGLLIKIARNPQTLDYARSQAKLALARMGNVQYFEELTAGLSSKEPPKRLEAIERLGDIGTDRAVGLLIPILDEKGGSYRTGPDTFTSGYRTAAFYSLNKARPEVWKQLQADTPGPRGPQITAWKDWWKEKANNSPSNHSLDRPAAR